MRTAVSIKTRLIAAVSFLIIAFIVAISYVTLANFEATTKELIANEQFLMVSLVANQIDDKLTNARDHLARFSTLFTASHLRDPRKARELMDAHEHFRSVFSDGLALFDTAAVLVAETPMRAKERPGTRVAVHDPAAAALAAGKPHIGAPHRSSRPHGHPVITLSAPIAGPNGQTAGVICGGIDLPADDVFRRIIGMRIGKTGYFYLVTRDRNLILHPDPGRVLKNDIPVGSNRLLERAIAGFEGTEETVNSRGLHAITSFKRLGATDWIVGANYPVAEAYAPIRQARKMLLLVVVVTIVLVSLIAWSLMNALTAPLSALTRHVEEMPRKMGAARLLPVASLDEIGRLTRAFNTMVTDLDRQHAEIDSQKERLAVTLRSIADGVIVTDTQGVLVLMNRVAEKLTGWSHESALGAPLHAVFALVDEKSRERLRDPVERVIAGGSVEPLPHPSVLVSRDGPEHFISGTCAPVRDSESRTIGAVLVFQDITEKRLLEEERARAEKLESIGLLAGGIAHDYNNILTAIIGNLSLAKLYAQEDARIVPLLDRVEKAATVAVGLAHQLLTFSKGGEPIKKTLSIAEPASEAVSFALRGSNVGGDFSFAPDLWPVDIDRGQIGQVMSNLAINAKQAMPGGGILKVEAVNCLLESDNALHLPAGRYVKTMLHDTGSGIPESDLPKIFDPYFTTKPGGSGLGLATSYSIVRKHRGIITVRSSVGAGTTFEIHLPASERASPDTARPGAGVHTGTGSILVMDDEEPVKAVLRDILTYLGYAVECASDGSEALRRYADAMDAGRPFDLVIMDLTIPGGMGGKETIKTLRKLDPEVRAIVSSGYSNDPVMSDFREYGFAGMALKPYQVAELSEQIEKALRK